MARFEFHVLIQYQLTMVERWAKNNGGGPGSWRFAERPQYEVVELCFLAPFAEYESEWFDLHKFTMPTRSAAASDPKLYGLDFGDFSISPDRSNPTPLTEKEVFD